MLVLLFLPHMVYYVPFGAHWHATKGVFSFLSPSPVSKDIYQTLTMRWSNQRQPPMNTGAASHPQPAVLHVCKASGWWLDQTLAADGGPGAAPEIFARCHNSSRAMAETIYCY